MKVVKPFSLVMIILVIASFTFFKKEAFACEMIGLTEFNELLPNLYVDQSIDQSRQNELANALQHAVDRVTNTYGKPKSNPRIIATANTKYTQFGFNPTGMQRSGFFRECVFLGPKGLNIDVIAHELVHAEVRHRTNLFTELTQIPAWFIEGTGVKVDYRTPFLRKNIKATNSDVALIKSVFYLSDFPNTDIKYYQASLLAVEPLDSKKMYHGLERLNNGEQFEHVFSELFK